MMTILLAIFGFLTLLIGLYFLLRDFSRFIIKMTFGQKRKSEFFDFGEYASTWFVVISFSFLGFFFFKFFTVLVSYFFSNDLISFFTLLRGVFTTKNEVQNPFSLVHFISGFLITPALHFISCFMIYRGIRLFMLLVNRHYKRMIYGEKDLLYFGFWSVMAFILFEIIFYSQYIPGVSGVAHLTYLGVSRLSFIVYYLALGHAYLLKNEQYRNSLPTYINLNRVEKKIIFSPWRTIILSYFIGVILYLPFFTGTQFLENNWTVLFIFLFSCLSFYLVLRFFLSHGFNFLGVIMLVESPESVSEFTKTFTEKTKRNILLAGAIITIFFASLKFKLFFLILFFCFLTLIFFLFVHILIYTTGLFYSLARAKHRELEIPEIQMPIILNYLLVIGKSTLRSSATMLLFMFFMMIFISILPKKYEDKNKNYLQSVFDKQGEPLYIEYFDNNGSIPIPYSEIPPFLLKCLFIQEDRDFMQQNSWFPKTSNWHGTSPVLFYRTLSGKGGSNINMQLIKNMSFEGTFPQDVQRKFSETLCGYELSIQCTREYIVTQYLNKVSMNGGSGHSGLMAASLNTFGLPPSRLNPLEMMYLVASLKRGTQFKTKSGYVNYKDVSIHSPKIKETLLKQAESWFERNFITNKEFNSLKNQELRFVNSRYSPACFMTSKEFLRKQISIKNKPGITFTSAITLANQNAMQRAVGRFDSIFSKFQKNGSYDLYSAAIVVNIKTGEIIGHYGGKEVTDLTTLGGGSNMGSIIKPALILSLLEMGFQADGIRLYDGPVKGMRTPHNYSRRYSHRYIGIDEVLSKSVNAATVNTRLLTEPIRLFKNVEEHFKQMGIPPDPYLHLDNSNKRNENILNYPLGSRNMSIYNIAQVFQTIFNEGRCIKLSALKNYYDPINDTTIIFPEEVRQVYTASNANRIKAALHHTMMKGGTANHLTRLLPKNKIFYAKTGTSDESRHGYIVLTDGDTLIVTWVSYGENKNGHLSLGLAPIPFESGGRNAGILAALIYNELDLVN